MHQQDTPSTMAAVTNVVEAIQHKAELLGHKPAFIFRDRRGGRRMLSFQQSYDLGGRWAAVLRSRSLGPGDLVVNTLPNSPERVITELGIVLSGAVSVNGQCQLADGSDLLHVLRKSRAQAIVLDPDVTNSPWNVLKCYMAVGKNGGVTSNELPSLKHLYLVRRMDECGNGDFMNHLETLTDRYQADVKPDDAITVFTTSGTTGFSKLVVHTHASLVSALYDGNLFANDPKQHVEFSIAPLGWFGGYACHPFLLGYTRVLCDVRAGPPDDMVEFTQMCIQEEKCTRAYLLPAVVLQLAERVQCQRQEDGVDTEACLQRKMKEADLEAQRKEGADTVVWFQREVDGADKDASRLHLPRLTLSDPPWSWQWVLDYIFYGGLPISRAMVKAARSLARQVIICYGGTELMVVASNIVEDADSYVDHDCGPASAVVKVKVVDPEDANKVLAPGEVGHLHIKRPTMMKEYLNDTEATVAALTPDGYFRTGDIGCVDDRGHLIVQGRGSDAIMRGPYIFFPGWLEARIRACPGVSDVMVVGVPDPLVNEELCACLVMTSDDVTVEQVRQFVEKDILASEDDPLSPRPRHYLKFESFPLTSTDKPNRKVIKQWAATLSA